jgi:hypothetical protein
MLITLNAEHLITPCGKSKMNIVRINGTGGQPIVPVNQSHTVNNSRTIKPVQQVLTSGRIDEADCHQLSSKLRSAVIHSQSTQSKQNFL